MRYSENYEVTSHDIDINNQVRPSQVIRYMQETANHQLRDRKPTYLDLFADGLSFVVSRMTVEIYAQLHQYEPIHVSTWSCPAKGATFIRCYEIRREGEVVARAYSAWAMNNLRTGKLCRTSEIDLSRYESEEALQMNLPVRFRLPRDIAYEKVGTREVLFSDVDMNLHMNNTNYPDMLWNYIPEVEKKRITSINLRFMKEAHLGSTLEIFRGRLPEGPAGDEQAEEGFCFVTKVGGEVNVEAVFGAAPKEALTK